MGAESAFPLGAAIQGVAGLAQSIIGGIGAHKAQRQLEKLVSSYKPNASIMDFYNKALNKYNVNPYTSQSYQYQTNQAQRGLATGINALQDRRSVLAGLPSLIQQQQDLSSRAAAQAEGESSRNLAQLGQATQMKAAEEKYPFQLKYGLLASKAGGQNQLLNAGLQNIFGAASSLTQRGLYKQAYGQEQNTQQNGTNRDFLTI